jgi:hypothetical protein
VIEITAPASAVADIFTMNHPVLASLDLADVAVCARCGHPRWDQLTGDACAECASRERATACSLYLLNDFTTALPHDFDISIHAG